MDYASFKALDFAQDPAFRAWTLEQAPAETEFWENWLLTHPEKQLAVSQARKLLLDLRNQPNYATDADVRAGMARLNAALVSLDQQPDEQAHEPAIRPLWHRLGGWRSAAAAAVVAAVGLWWGTRQPGTEQPLAATNVPQSEWTERINDGQRTQLVNLPDESSVVLQPGSRLAYRTAFDSLREVRLVGEGFFEVTKDADHPFVVYANDVVTKVLGTSFTVRAYASEANVRVSVRTGRVSVFRKADYERTQTVAGPNVPTTVLLPNQQMVVAATAKQLPKSEVSLPLKAINDRAMQRFTFVRTPVSQVFIALEQTYGVQIKYDSLRMQRCSLTATLTDEPLPLKLDIICRALDATYEQANGQVTIRSQGCQ
jgi:transmembrane sensor